jgi:DNA-binding response OmpR family regulator
VVSRVLVVEDEPSLQRLCKLELEDEGHEVRAARDTSEAWSHVENWRPDVAVVDMRLGHDSGLSLLRRLIEADSPIRTVIYSGYSNYRDPLTSQLADAFVMKSVDLSELKITVRRLVTATRHTLPWEEPAGSL